MSSVVFKYMYVLNLISSQTSMNSMGSEQRLLSSANVMHFYYMMFAISLLGKICVIAGKLLIDGDRQVGVKDSET